MLGFKPSAIIYEQILDMCTLPISTGEAWQLPFVPASPRHLEGSSSSSGGGLRSSSRRGLLVLARVTKSP